MFNTIIYLLYSGDILNLILNFFITFNEKTLLAIIPLIFLLYIIRHQSTRHNLSTNFAKHFSHFLS